MKKKLKLISKNETADRLSLSFAEDVNQQPGKPPTAKTIVNVILTGKDIEAAASLKSGQEYTITIA